MLFDDRGCVSPSLSVFFFQICFASLLVALAVFKLREGVVMLEQTIYGLFHVCAQRLQSFFFALLFSLHTVFMKERKGGRGTAFSVLEIFVPHVCCQREISCAARSASLLKSKCFTRRRDLMWKLLTLSLSLTVTATKAEATQYHTKVERKSSPYRTRPCTQCHTFEASTVACRCIYGRKCVCVCVHLLVFISVCVAARQFLSVTKRTKGILEKLLVGVFTYRAKCKAAALRTSCLPVSHFVRALLPSACQGSWRWRKRKE